ncbi:hypothetical protein PG988_007333 [Apiospora saccharicola]
MGDERGRQEPSNVDHVGVGGNAVHSLVAGNATVGNNIAYGYLNSMVAHSLSIKGGVTWGVPADRVAQRLKKVSRLDSSKKNRQLEETMQTVPSTGDWILNDDTYLQWTRGEFKHLWCYGKAGVGKPVLATKIIHHLREENIQRGSYDKKTRGLLYVYFDYQQRDTQTPAAILADLLSQLLSHKQSVLPVTVRLYNDSEDEDELLGPLAYLHPLEAEAAIYHQVYLVLDGLDEYIDETNENRPKILMDIISDLPENFKVLVTSRSHKNIFESVKFDKYISIKASDKDLAAFLEWRIGRSNVLERAFQDSGNKSDGIWGMNNSDLVAKFQGNFLHAQLEINAIEDDTAHNAMDNSPRSSSFFYERAILRIESQKDPERDIALAALNWVCYAARPLSITEFSQAIAGHQVSSTINSNTMEFICAGLVTVDDSDVIRLLHYTAHEFLERKAYVRFRDSHISLARRCLDDLLERSLTDAYSNPQRVSTERSAYLTYDADHWGYHFRRARGDPEASRLAKVLLGNQRKISEALGYMETIPSHLKLGVTALHISTFFGSKELVLHSIRHLAIDIDSGTGTSHTATHWAVIFQQHRILQVLLEQGANADAQDAKGRTPLHLAISTHDEWSIRILLEHSRSFNGGVEDEKGFTPLRFAAREGHLWAVKLLLPASVHYIDAEDKDGYSALRWAFKMGHDSIVRLLVDAGANINTPSSRDNWLIMSEAAANCQARAHIIRFLLLERPGLRVELNKQDWVEKAPLQLAVEYGGSDVAYLLLRAGADPSIRDKAGRTLVHHLIENWSNIQDKAVLWMLVEHRCNLELRDDTHGQTALELAITQGNMSATWLLVQNGALLGTQDSQGRTPLHLAVESKQPLIASLLLDKGAKYEVLDINGYAPLHNATEMDNHAMISTFLTRGMGQNVRSKSGQTPLHLAVMKKHTAQIQSLLQHRADPDISDRSGRTPLYLAIMETKCPHAVGMLVHATRQLRAAANYEQQSYLHLAALSGELALVQTVLAAGAIPINQQDAQGRTPLHAAIANARSTVIARHLVRDLGADVNVADIDGYSALHHAAELGDKDLISTLVAHNGDVHGRNKQRKTPIEVAESAGHTKIRWA